MKYNIHIPALSPLTSKKKEYVPHREHSLEARDGLAATVTEPRESRLLNSHELINWTQGDKNSWVRGI